MLAVIHKSIAHAPEELSVPEASSPDCRTKGGELLAKFQVAYPDSMSVHFDGNSAMAFTHKNQALLRPRYIYCHFLSACKLSSVICLCGSVM
jgi:hypothetical protein